MNNFIQIVVLVFITRVLSAWTWKALKHYSNQIPIVQYYPCDDILMN